MTRKVVYAALAAVAIGYTPGSVGAQEGLLAELYGQGVHAYFANDYSRAHAWLTKAIEQGSQDPRCYYFRGLAYRRLGRPDEARQDFEKGAQLEATARGRAYPVGRALQRVQGPSRIALETHRREARVNSRLKNRTATQARYEALQQAEKRVVRGSQPERPQLNPRDLLSRPAQLDAADPFTAAAETPTPAPPRAKPTEIATDANSEPAATSAAAAPASSTDRTPPSGDVFGGAGTTGSGDPFGGGAAPAAGSTTSSTDPFGGGNDPFGGSGSTTPAAGSEASKPAADDPFGGGGDPFGGGGSSTPAADGGSADPLGGSTDPFGGSSKPAESSGSSKPDASDDPFGGSDDVPSNPFVDDEPEDDNQPAEEMPKDSSDAPAADPFADPFGT